VKEKIYNPASTNETAPADGMAAVNTFNSEEVEEVGNQKEKAIPKNFERDHKREQEDDTKSLK